MPSTNLWNALLRTSAVLNKTAVTRYQTRKPYMRRSVSDFLPAPLYRSIGGCGAVGSTYSVRPVAWFRDVCALNARLARRICGRFHKIATCQLISVRRILSP